MDILTANDIEIFLDGDLDEGDKFEFFVEAKRRIKSGNRSESSGSGLARQSLSISDKSMADVVEALVALFFLR